MNYSPKLCVDYREVNNIPLECKQPKTEKCA